MNSIVCLETIAVFVLGFCLNCATLQPGYEQSKDIYAVSVIAVVAIIALVGLIIWWVPRWPGYYKVGSEPRQFENHSSSSNGMSKGRENPSVSPDTDVADGVADCYEPRKSFDVAEGKLGGLTKSERTRLLEERAEARMRANAARQKGENNPDFSPDTDVAEGVAAADKKKHE